MPMASLGSPPIWRSTERATVKPTPPTTAITTSTSTRSASRVLRTRASMSSVYSPEPTIQFQPSTRITYCSLGTSACWPGRANMVGTNTRPSLLALSASEMVLRMSVPSPSLTLPAMSWPSHSGLMGCITPLESRDQI